MENCRGRGLDVSHAHLRYIQPFPRNLGDVLGRFEQIMIPELNMGQLNIKVRARFLRETRPFNKVQGKPFTIRELEDRIAQLLAGAKP